MTGRFTCPAPGSGSLMRFMKFLEEATGLDRLIEAGQRAARLLPPGRTRDALHGVWLGHPLHPMLVQVPVGAWLSASLLDAWPGNETTSRRLVLAGLAASVPATLAGTADWSEQHEQQMRVGAVHAAANMAATGLYAASVAVPARARMLRLAGLAAAGPAGSWAATSPTASPQAPTRPNRCRTSSSPAGTTSCRSTNWTASGRSSGCSATCPLS